MSPSPSTTSIEVHILKALRDRYTFIVKSGNSADVLVIDPFETIVLDAFLRSKSWNKSLSLFTHLNDDIPDADLLWGGHRIQSIPMLDLEHGQYAYLLSDVGILFTGECLSVMGLGPAPPTSLETFWSALDEIKALPPETQVYCNIERSAANAMNAMSLFPEDQAIKLRTDQIFEARAKHLIPLPSTIAVELKTNPYFRMNHSQFVSSCEERWSRIQMQIAEKSQRLPADILPARRLRLLKIPANIPKKRLSVENVTAQFILPMGELIIAILALDPRLYSCGDGTLQLSELKWQAEFILAVDGIQVLVYGRNPAEFDNLLLTMQKSLGIVAFDETP